jgi:hypothetical protein
MYACYTLCPSKPLLRDYLTGIERNFEQAPAERCESMHPGYWFDAELLSDGTSGVAGFFESMEPVSTATREMIRWLSSGFEFGEPPSSISLWDR